jgi:Holliday junction DNA helicase RuvA
LIARLTGRAEALEDGRCIVDVNGVGYLVHASTRTLSALPAPPELARMLVETHVREEAILLYGFIDAAERDLFRLLTTVQGVGGRVALSVLSVLSPANVAAAIAAGDRASLTRVPGVGARLAARLLTELRDKVGAVPVAAPFVPGSTTTPQMAEDTISALLNLGYRRQEVHSVVTQVMERAGPAVTLDTVLRDSLKELAQRTTG